MLWASQSSRTGGERWEALVPNEDLHLLLGKRLDVLEEDLGEENIGINV